MTTIESWSRLSEAEQLAQWRAFLEALDAGDAGYHPWRPVLLRLWDRGEVPDIIEAEQLAARDAEIMQDTAWAAQTLPAFDPGDPYLGYGAPPF